MTKLFEILFPKYIWRIKTSEKKIYLTFDDGPIPEVTEWVLAELKKFGAKATFFCVGENIENNPAVFEKIIKSGHAIGNHTYNHLKGWETDDESYLNNFSFCQYAIEKNNLSHSLLFRPPYGRIKKSQAKEILKSHKIVMWSVLTKDYDVKFSPEECLKRTINKTKPGSIVLFHDSLKAEKNMKYVLPNFLKHFYDLGYEFEVIN
ncbi:polysaccharide deacetylase family protein [Lacihabitans sp. LS3-19]|uniref:polysaccharide deacetylase family protein n=1 Tax=Lacihabitans sp. LS3-19 TaxID=2487335 RepID=UPI0020CFD992|nr:polysaccharide deacetylase family protein [Lacihabitans sp. LS3-19]MCP9768890.1 polysaccharide deacetylase family protein [Lacihabitans sp. LS3-19]